MAGLFFLQQKQDTLIIDNVATLRATTIAPDVKTIDLLGYHSANDGGGSDCFVDRTDVTTIDDGALCFVSANGIRVKRVVINELNLLWFGAKRDLPANITNDQSTFFNKAIVAANERTKVLYVPLGNYRIYNSITVPDAGIANLRVYGSTGNNGNTTLFWHGNNTDAMFELFGYNGSSFEGFIVSVASPLNYGFRLKNENKGGTPTALKLRDIWFSDNTFIFNPTAPKFNGKGINYGISFLPTGAGGDNNNDLPILERVEIRGAHIGFHIDGFNCHEVVFNRCYSLGCNWAVVAVSGNFRWLSGHANYSTYADFLIRGISHSSAIIGHNSEHSGAFIFVPASLDVPLFIANVRFNGTVATAPRLDASILINHTNKASSISFHNCEFASTRNRIQINWEGTLDQSSKNAISFVGCRWIRTLAVGTGTNGRLGGVNDLIADLCSIADWFIKPANVSVANNWIDLGVAHNIPDNHPVRHDSNDQFNTYGLLPNTVYYIRSVSGQPNVIRLATAFDGTPITLATGSIQFTLRLTFLFINTADLDAPTIIGLQNAVMTVPSLMRDCTTLEPGNTNRNLDTGTNRTINLAALTLNQLFKIFRVTVRNTNALLGIGNFTVTIQSPTAIKNYLISFDSNLADTIESGLENWYEIGASNIAGSNLADSTRLVGKVISRKANPAGTLRFLTVELAIIPGATANYTVSVQSVGGNNANNVLIEDISNTAAITTLPPIKSVRALVGVLQDSVTGLLTKPNGIVPRVLTGTSITPDLSSSNSFSIDVGTAITFNNPVGLLAGVPYVFSFNQLGGGSVTFGGAYLFPTGDDTTLTTTVGAKDSVRCISDDGSFLRCEIRKSYNSSVLGSVNVAIGKTATVLSTLAGTSASNALDGDITTNYTSGSNSTNEFFLVDLGKAYLIQSIVIIPVAAGFPRHAQSINLFASLTDPAVPTATSTLLGATPAAGITNQNSVTVTLTSPVLARYVRAQNAKTDNLAFSEFRVMV